MRAALLLFTLLAVPAAAQAPAWYLGASAGQSRAGSSLASDREAAIGNGNEPNMQTASDLRDAAGKLYAGWRFSPALAVEAHWTRLGGQRIENAFDVPYGATGKGGVLTEREVQGFGLDLVAAWEFSPGWSLHGRLGAFRAEVTTDTTLSGDTRFADGTPGSFRRVSQDDTALKAGLGVEHAFTSRLAGRLEWERFSGVGKRLTAESRSNAGEADQDAWWLGVVLRF